MLTVTYYVNTEKKVETLRSEAAILAFCAWMKIQEQDARRAA